MVGAGVGLDREPSLDGDPEPASHDRPAGSSVTMANTNQRAGVMIAVTADDDRY
jgi:hypothetical protein